MALVIFALGGIVLVFPASSNWLFVGTITVAVGIALVTYHRELRREGWRWLRVAHPRLFLLIAVVLMVMSAIYFLPDRTALKPLTPAVGRALIAFSAGGGFLLFSLWLRAQDAEKSPADAPSLAPDLASAPSPLTVPRWAYRPLVVTCGVGLLLFAAETSANGLKVPWLEHVHYNVQIVALLAGIALTAWGMGYTPRTDDETNNESGQHIRIRRWEGVLIVGIAVFALFLRWWELDSRLLNLVDELNFISHVRHFWAFPDNPVLRPMTDIVPFTKVFSFGESITVAIFGRNFEGVRAFSGLIGTANVIALWWLARQIVDRRVALIAALLLATFPPHMHFSRLALNNIADPLFGTLAFGCILRALRTQRRMDFALAGMCLGCIPYFYEGGRLLFPIIFVLWGVWVIWVVWRQRITPLRRQNLIVLIVTAVCVAFPVYYNIASWTGNLTGRMAFSGLDAGYWETLIVGDTADALRGYADNLGRSFLFYVNRPELFIHYGGSYGLILPVIVPTFLLGLMYSLWGTVKRNYGLALVLFWFVLAGLGNSALVDPGVSTRHVVTFPAVALLMAIGLVWTVDLLIGRLSQLQIDPRIDVRARITPPSPRANMIVFGIVILLVAVVAIRQVDYYFNSHLPQLEYDFRELAPYRDVNDMMLRAVDLPAGTQLNLLTDVVYSGRDAADLLSYLVDGMTVTTIMTYDIPNDFFMLMDYTRPQAFFIAPDDTETLDLIRTFFGTLPAPQYTTNPVVTRNNSLALYFFPPTVYNQPVNPATITDTPARHTTSLLQLGGVLLGAVLFVGTIGLVQGLFPATFAPFKKRAMQLLALFRTEAQQVPFIPQPTAFAIGVVVLVAVTLLNSSAEPALKMPIWMQFGGLLVGVALVVRGFLPARAIPPVPADPEPMRFTRRFELIRVRLRQITNPKTNALIQRPASLFNGILLLVVVTLANRIDRPEVCLPIWLQLGFFAGGMILIVRGVSRGAKTESSADVLPQSPVPTVTPANLFSNLRTIPLKQVLIQHWESLTLTAILLVALLVRVANLEYGVHWFVDEMHSVSAVNNLREMPYTAIFKPFGDITAFTWLYPLLQSIGVSVYGASLTGLRVVSVLAGTATVWALWWLARGLFDRRVALLSALVLATFPPHIHFSRIGINNIADPLFGTLALAFLAHAFLPSKNTTTRLSFALAGVALGMTQYFYEGGRLLYPLMVLAWIVVWIIFQRLRVDWRGLFITGITFCLTTAPVYMTWQAGKISSAPRLAANVNPDNFWYLIGDGNIGGAVSEFVRALGEPLRMLFGGRDQSWFYGGDFGLILPFMMPFFVIGCVWAIRRFYDPRRALLLLWLVGVVLGMTLLELQRESPRYVVVFPAMALLIALGIDRIYGWLVKISAKPILTRTFSAVLLLLCLSQPIYYFGMHLPRYNTQNREAAIFDDLLFRLVTLPAGTNVYIISDGSLWVPDITTMLYFHQRGTAYTIRVMTPDEVDSRFLEDLPARGQFAFFIHSTDSQVEAQISQRFDLSHLFYSPYDRLPEDQQFLLYFVSE